ncbi:Dps family protein [Actibacterium ureilyticum]|uniref:Dps family protein n=1 Tax=Actibacterium ureilyticum TaxID=1590614 RepID=UPI000BAAC9AA|nr:DNA starvation/stationary phase protection protein [Actibacterium ureilyticum]
MTDAMKIVPQTSDVETGVGDASAVAEALAKSLADTYRLVFKTHACHWNVEGPLFYSIHNLTEAQYTDMFTAADEIAERVRALGKLAPSALDEIIEHSVVKDQKSPASAQEMVEGLASDHETVAKRMHKAIELAEDESDPVTADLLTARSAFHESAAWMLRATAK